MIISKTSWWLILIALVIIDQTSKWIVLRDETFIVNTGVAWGLAGGMINAGVLVVGIGLLITTMVTYFMRKQQYLLEWVLIIGGATGNWLDRVMYEGVVDWIRWVAWFPYFNLADVAISCGVVIYLVMIFTKHEITI